MSGFSEGKNRTTVVIVCKFVRKLRTSFPDGLRAELAAEGITPRLLY